MNRLPWETREHPIGSGERTMVVDLRRCTGCHACSVACKVEHGVPLGQFRMRVRWMEDPTDGRMAFLPVFDARRCDFGEARELFGRAPACVSACPTGALIFGDRSDKEDPVSKIAAAARSLENPGDTKPDVLYLGHADWQEQKLNRGVALHPDDEDIIYEQS